MLKVEEGGEKTESTAWKEQGGAKNTSTTGEEGGVISEERGATAEEGGARIGTSGWNEQVIKNIRNPEKLPFSTPASDRQLLPKKTLCMGCLLLFPLLEPFNVYPGDA